MNVNIKDKIYQNRGLAAQQYNNISRLFKIVFRQKAENLQKFKISLKFNFNAYLFIIKTQKCPSILFYCSIYMNLFQDLMHIFSHHQQQHLPKPDFQTLHHQFHHQKLAFIEFLQTHEIKILSQQVNSTLKLDIKCKLQWPGSPQTALEYFDIVVEKITSMKIQRKNWSKLELGLLFFILMKILKTENICVQQLKESHWDKVGYIFPGRSKDQCLFKWLTLRKYYVTRYPWTEEEDFILQNLVRENAKPNWISVSQRLYILNNTFVKPYRSGKQCRQRWISHHNASLKRGKWQIDEDLTLIEMFQKLGKKWFEISKMMNHRTQNAIKNRFNLLIQKNAMEDEQKQMTLERLCQTLKKKQGNTSVEYTPTATNPLNEQSVNSQLISLEDEMHDTFYKDVASFID